MLKTLRRKFIWSAVLSFASAIILILGIVNAVNYYNVMLNVDARIDMLSGNGMQQENGPGGEDPIRQRFGGMFGLGGRVSDEAMFDSRYFTVTLNEKGTAVEINTGKIAAIASEDAEMLADTLYGRNLTRGVVDTYRFRAEQRGPFTVYFFLDCSRELTTFYSFLTISVLAALIGLAVVTALIVICSKMAIAPVAESYNKQKRFITDASHELKTPLAVINAANEVTELESGETEWTKSIHKQISRLTSLTEKLVMLSRMDEENYKPNIAPFNLSDAVRETADSFAPVAQYKGKNYTVQIEDGITCEGDENALRQLVSLLVDNAMKYSDDGGDISVSLKKSGRNTELKVENTTPGIQKGDQSILFERFYRADASRNSATGGHGIGLSVAKAIVGAHKGKITAVSPDGIRIVFTAVL